MANYSKLLSLISGADRTVDFSLAGNILELGGSGLQMDGSTSGHVSIAASATTTTYSMIWPPAQAASSGYVLSNDGTGVLSWVNSSSGSVSSVALSLPSSVFAVSGSPVTSSGTLTGTFQNQSANQVFAGPATGSAAAPTFRALVAADLPAGTGTVTSVALGVPAGTFLAVSGSPVTTSGTLQLTFGGGALLVPNGGTGNTSLPAHSVLLGAGTGNVASVSPGAVGSVLQGLGASVDPIFSSAIQLGIGGTTAGSIAIANGSSLGVLVTVQNLGATTAYNFNLPATPGSAGQVLTSQGGGSNSMTWSSAATGSVTSVALADDSTTPIYAISGSPITSSGTLGITLETQSANTVFAGPSTGSAAQPSFRALVAADIPSLSGAYANVNLSNLSSPTAINQDLVPASANSFLLGSALNFWGGAYSLEWNAVDSSGGNTVYGITSLAVQKALSSFTISTANDLAGSTATGSLSLITGNGEFNSSGNINLTTGSVVGGPGVRGTISLSGLFINANSTQIKNVADPTSAQDAMTLNYANANYAPISVAGSVTSVAFADDSTSPIYAVSGSPVTSSGTLAITLNTQNANLVFAGPGTGSAAQPSFRSLVSADIPSLSAIYLPLAGGTMSGSINMGSNSITSLASPVNPNDAVNKAYVDNFINATSWKTAVLVATTANITLSGEQTIDGVTTSASRVLVKNQSAPANNGIYVSAAGAWARSSDMNVWADVPAAAVFVESGTVNADLGWVCTSQPGGTLGTTAITFVQFSSAGAYSADNVTLQLISGVFSIKTGGVSPTQLGSVTDGVTLDQSGAGSTIEIKAAGVGTTQLAAASVTAAKLGAVTDGITADQSGAGSTIEVLNSPALKRTLVAGQSFAANTSYAVRWGVTGNGETAGRVYAADTTTSSFDLFYVIGMASSATSVSAGQSIGVTNMGSFALSSADTAFASGTDGEAVFLTAAGTFSTTPPNVSGLAVTRIGMVQVQSATVGSNIIDVWPQVIGVN